jgi:membrane-bound lytic murein transglycosylase D
MFKARYSSAVLHATFAAVTALVLSACSHTPVPTAPRIEDEPEFIEEIDAQMDAQADASIEVLGKVDEAEIGTLGPSQIEDAIETLDAKTEGEPALVREIGAGGIRSGERPADLFDRIRKGFTIADVDHEWIDREENWFAKHPTYLDRTFKRGERYMYHIVKELEARNMPLELALLPIVESAFNPVAYSRARASGLWQFIPSTGRRYGLKQNWYYDGRRDVVAATSSALDYLESLSAEFDGDWLLAVAAYNCGEANIERAIARNRKAGKPTDFFSLKLPKETRAYVPKLLAMSRIVADPTAHGLEFSPIANQPYFAKVDVGGQIDLHVAAELADLPKEELIALNPAFNHWVTDPDGPHHLLVPIAHETRFAEAVAALPPEERVRVVYHRVRPGDTIGGIASKYGVSVAAIRTANKLRGNVIRAGQDLQITAAPRGNDASETVARAAKYHDDNSSGVPSGKHVVRRGDTLWSIAKSHNVTVDRLASTNNMKRDDALSVGQSLDIPGTATLAATNPGAVSTSPMRYMVRAGDTLSRIATRFRVQLTDLLSWNDLGPTSVIKPCQRLVMYVDDRRRAGI